MMYLYGAVEDGRAARSALEEADHALLVRVLEVGGVSFLVRDSGAADAASDGGHIDALVAHDEALRQVMPLSAVVPFRFRTVISQQYLAAWVAGREQALAQAFCRVRGRRELALRARLHRAPTPRRDSRSGTSYLRALAGRSEGAAPLSNLHRGLSMAAAEAVAEHDGPGLKASYLVDHHKVDSFRGLLESAQKEMEALRVSLTGPWPPYSFVSGVELEPAAADLVGHG